MCFVYIIQHTETKQVYTGRTNNIKRRLEEHNQGKNLLPKEKEENGF